MILFDAFTDGTTNTTYAHTCTGADRLLIVIVRGNTTDTGASVTYGGVSMTQFNKVQIPGDRWVYAFYLLNPASGSNNVVITGTVNRTIAYSYTGVGAYESSTTNSGSSITSLTTSVTTVANNCWLIGWVDVAGGTSGAGTGTTSRGVSAETRAIDSNKSKSPVGSHSLVGTASVSTSIAMIVGSFSPSSPIAWDASTQGTAGTSSPQTYSHTCTGTDRILFVSVFSQTSVTSVTYAGVPMTELGNTSYSSPTGKSYLFMLVNPASGANNVVVTHSGSYHASVAVSYTGAKQSGQPDAAADTDTSGASTAASITTTVTTVADDSWTVMATACEGNALTASTGAYLRQTGSNVAVAMFDSNGAITPAGSYSMTVSESPDNRLCGVMASFAPVSAVTDITVSPSAQVITSSVPSYSVLLDRVISVIAQIDTFSIPTYSVSLPKITTPSTQIGTFSIPAYSIGFGKTVEIGVQEATFSIPAYAITAKSNVYPSAQVATFSVPTYSVLLDVVMLPIAQVLTFSLPTLYKVGAIWTKVARSTSATWSRISRNSN